MNSRNTESTDIVEAMVSVDSPVTRTGIDADTILARRLAMISARRLAKMIASVLTVSCLAVLGSCPCVTGLDINFEGDEKLSHIISPLPYTYIQPESLPKNFYWGDVGGKSYTTRMLNQHLPQFCEWY